MITSTLCRVTLVFDPSDPERASLSGLAPPDAVMRAMRSTVVKIALGTRRLPLAGENWVDDLGEEPDG
jgi:hypothetical protein